MNVNLAKPGRSRLILHATSAVLALASIGAAGCTAELRNDNCETASTPLASAETPSEAGFSVADVVLRMQSIRTTFQWHPVGNQHATYVPSDGATQLALTTTVGGEGIEDVRVLAHDATRTLGFNACRPHLTAALQLRMVTDDGALNETVPAKLIAYSPEEATLSGDVTPAELGGSFRVTSFDQPSLTYFVFIRIKGETVDGFFGGRSFAPAGKPTQGTTTPVETTASGAGFVAGTWTVPSTPVP